MTDLKSRIVSHKGDKLPFGRAVIVYFALSLVGKLLIYNNLSYSHVPEQESLVNSVNPTPIAHFQLGSLPLVAVISA